ncbi:HAD-like domain-containing protein [Cyathus striatus]|nr:HAD-like domain-containing protein [Cyathus striatus]
MQRIEAFVFDVFGTVVDWRSTVTRELKQFGEKHNAGQTNSTDWGRFAQEWRRGYIQYTRRVAAGGEGSKNVDVMHRQILDNMLQSEEWGHLGALWDEQQRQQLNLVWHRLDGWSDASPGLYEIKKNKIIATLSNGNVRLLVDMAKHADLPWDAVFSGELFDAYKPNPKTYREALRHLSIEPSQCAMVAAHIYDLRAAAKEGIKTVYISRPQEESEPLGPEGVKSKAEGGEIDWVVKDFHELAKIAAEA